MESYLIVQQVTPSLILYLPAAGDPSQASLVQKAQLLARSSFITNAFVSGGEK